MKKLTFSFILVIGLIFSFSIVSSAQVSHLAEEVIALKQGDFKPKDQILSGLQDRLQVLYHELSQFPMDPETEKTKNVETLLYKRMISDIIAGRAVSSAYQENGTNFLLDYPGNGDLYLRKKITLQTFNTYIFLN